MSSQPEPTLFDHAPQDTIFKIVVFKHNGETSKFGYKLAAGKPLPYKTTIKNKREGFSSEFSLFVYTNFLIFPAVDITFSQALEPVKDNYEVAYKIDVWEVREKSEQLILEQAVDVVDGINLILEPTVEMEDSANNSNEADKISEAKKVLKGRILESKSSER